MAKIQFGLKSADAIQQNFKIIFDRLVRGYKSVMGKNPEGLDLIKIRFEAAEKARDSAKVVDRGGMTLDPNKPIMGGTQEGAALRSGIMRATGARPKTLIEKAIDDASPGFSGDRKVDAELVAENLAERMGKVYDDMPTKERIKLYDEAFTGLSKKKFDPEGKADGGRIGYKIGSLDKARRAFLKKAAGIGGGIAALKTGLLGISKKAPETIETVKETVKQAPDYFFALVDKIRRLGTMVDDAVADPRMERTYRYKNYELRENAYGTPDETVVTKIDDRGEFGYKEESMVYKKGGMTEEGRVADEYEEFTIRPDEDGKLKDVDTGIADVSDIIKEATDQAPSIKKAGGGLAYMLGE